MIDIRCLVCAPWSSLANSMSSGFPQPPDAPCNFIPPHSSMPRIPASVGRLPPPLIPLHSQLNTQPNTQSNVYRCSYILSDGSEHHGEGRTSNIAKASAALNALFSLRPLLSEMEAKMKDEKRSEGQDPRKKHVNDSFSNSIDVTKPKEESLTSESDEENEEEMCTIACGNDKREDQAPKQQGRSKPKSVVSQIHECAYRLKMNVEFEVIEETGEPVSFRKLSVVNQYDSSTIAATFFVALFPPPIRSQLSPLEKDQAKNWQNRMLVN